MNQQLSLHHSNSGYLYSQDQTALFYRHYAVEGQKATVLLVHGFGEHSGRYLHVVEELLARHFEVFCIDFRGHGRSHGKRGDVQRFRCYEEDLSAAIKFVKTKKKPDQKLFILAHSMGALVSLRLISHESEGISGMVLSAPLFALNLSIPTWKKCAASAIAKVIPTMKFPSGIKGRELSTDPIIARAYDEDPLVLKCISVRAVDQIQEGVKNAQELKVTPSFFMQVAGRDTIVDTDAAKHWFKKVEGQNKDASLKVYDDFLHEIYNEKRRDEAINDAMQWIEERV